MYTQSPILHRSRVSHRKMKALSLPKYTYFDGFIKDTPVAMQWTPAALPGLLTDQRSLSHCHFFHIIVTYLIPQPLVLTFTHTYDLHPVLHESHRIIYPLFSPKLRAKETSGQPVCWQWTWCRRAWCWWCVRGKRQEESLPVLLTSTSG